MLEGMVSAVTTLVTLLLGMGSPTESATLKVGDVVHAKIDESDALDDHASLTIDAKDVPVRRRTYRLEGPGPLYVTLHSLVFDPHLVLRSIDGDVLREDGDGWFGWHSRIEVPAGTPGPWLVDVCAIEGITGEFELTVLAGEPTPVSEREHEERRLADSEAVLDAHRRAFGPTHLRTAERMLETARCLEEHGQADPATALYEEAIAVHEAALGPDDPATAVALGMLGDRLRVDAQYARALPILERVLEIEERAFGPDAPRLHFVVNRLAQLHHDLGEFDTARGYYERDLHIRETTLGSDHPATISALNNLGGLLFDLGDHVGAREVLRRALSKAEAVHGPDHPDTTPILTSMMASVLHDGDLVEARSMIARVVRIREAALGPDHPDTVDALSNLAAVVAKFGEYDTCRALYERVLLISERMAGPDHPETAHAQMNLAAVLSELGEFEAAERLLRSAQETQTRVLGPTHPLALHSADNLAILRLRQGYPAEARLIIERVLRSRESSLDPNDPRIANSAALMADALADLNDHRGAYEYLVRTHRINEVAFGPDHFRTMSTRANIGVHEYLHGDPLAAREVLSEVADTFERTLGLDHRRTVRCLYHLANVLVDLGESQEARRVYRRALSGLEEIGGSDRSFAAGCLSGLAAATRELGEVDEAWELHHRALAIRRATLGPHHPRTVWSLIELTLLELDRDELDVAWEHAAEAHEATGTRLARELGALSEAGRLLAFADHRLSMRALLSVAKLSPGRNRSAYAAVLAGKGRVGRSLLRPGHERIEPSDEERALIERLRRAQAALSDALYERSVADTEDLSERLTTLREERNALEVELVVLRSRDGASSIQDRSLDEVTTALPRDAVAIDFLVHGRYERGEMGRPTGPHVTAWVLRPDAPLLTIDLGPASALEDATSRFLAELVARRGLSVSEVAEGDQAGGRSGAAAKLHARLWAPLSAAVGDARTVVISPDSFLGALPFETIQDATDAFLIERHAFVYLADLQRLPNAMTRIDAGEPSLFAVGDVDYRHLSEGDPEPDAVPSEARASLSRRWSPLAWTGTEVDTIQDVHLEGTDDDGRQLVLRGADASEEAVKRSLAGFTHVHLATHGYFHPEGLPSAWRRVRDRDDESRRTLDDAEARVTGSSPGLLSGLVFSGANSKHVAGRDNGLLTAEEITTLDLRGCDLITLSACETGIGRPEAGEGMIGLRRSFRMAGARTVISSLWEVSDAATRDLMTLFYENLWLEEMSKLEALHEAQLMLLDHNREQFGHPLPSTWGAFVLDGAPE